MPILLFFIGWLSKAKVEADKRGLKGKFTKNWKFSHYLLTLMLMEGWVKLFSPQNTAGLSKEKGVVVISQTIAAKGGGIWHE